MQDNSIFSEGRIVVLDGAMGTMLQRAGLAGNSEAFNFSNPEVIKGIHEAYIAAGADIITANTFSANRLSQEGYGMADKAADMAREGVRIAREAADAAGRKVLVAGSVGPTGKSLELLQFMDDPNAVTAEQMTEAYAEQISAIAEAGADMLLLETCFDSLNANAAVDAIAQTGCSLPLMVSVSPNDRRGFTMMGMTMQGFYESISHCPNLVSFGLNCAFGAQDLEPIVRELAPVVKCALSCHPNAGLPDAEGKYGDTPAMMAEILAKMASDGLLNMVGGCCGTTPEHIAAVAEAVRDAAPRKYQ